MYSLVTGVHLLIKTRSELLVDPKLHVCIVQGWVNKVHDTSCREGHKIKLNSFNYLSRCQMKNKYSIQLLTVSLVAQNKRYIFT